MTPEILLELVTVLVPLLLSLTVHEYAHAATARALGDDTASRMGRYTLNPLSHIDPIGSLLLPALLVVSGTGILFGWARPVPFDPLRFTRRLRMKHGILLTAAAGPLANLVLAVLAAGLLGFVRGQEAAETLLHATVVLNVMLFFFNLLPVPPLDGSKVAFGLLPDRATGALRALEQHPWVAPAAFVAVVFLGGRLIAPPMLAVSRFLLETLAS